MPDYAAIARESRLKVLDLIYAAQTSHIGSNFSAADIFAVLFEKLDLDKDKFILSAGWKAALLYYHLWRKGRITEDELNSYCQEGSKFIGLAEPIHPDIPFAGGSMGMGFSAAVGFALAKKLKGEEGTIYCLMSDGEMQIGTTWEAALIAAQHKLSNLVVIVDYNGLQAMGKVSDILSVASLSSKWESFNWHVHKVDGHHHEKLQAVLETPNEVFSNVDGFLIEHKPAVIIAHTLKGKGVSFMEGSNIFHYKAPNEDEYLRAKVELT